jgi:hypothetical protein
MRIDNFIVNIMLKIYIFHLKNMFNQNKIFQFSSKITFHLVTKFLKKKYNYINKELFKIRN